MVFQGGKQVIKFANTSISSLLFAVRASTVATALKKVTIIYPRFAIILIKGPFISYERGGAGGIWGGQSKKIGLKGGANRKKMKESGGGGFGRKN